MRLYKRSFFALKASAIPILIFGSLNHDLKANDQIKLESKKIINTQSNLPSEAFLNFLASGISIKSEKATESTESTKHIEPLKNQVNEPFIDPMELHELDNIGLLKKLKQESYSKQMENNLKHQNQTESDPKSQYLNNEQGGE